MIKNELVSIIIPCFQHQHFLEGALDSIEMQSYKNIEVIIIDDGSIPEIVLPNKQWSFDVRLIRQENGGLSSARNLGIKNARGLWTKFLDADDTLLPNCITAQVTSIRGAESNYFSSIAYIDRNEFTGLDREIYPKFGHPAEAILQINIGPPHIFLYPTELIRSTDGFDTSPRVDGGHEDYAFIMNLISMGAKLVTLHELGVVYFRRIGSMSANCDNMARTRAAVWAHYMPSIVARYPTENIASAAITSWCNLVKVTPSKYHSSLKEAPESLSNHIKNNNLKIEEREINSLICLLNTIEDTGRNLITASLQEDRVLSSRNQISWTSQEIFDRRLTLINQGELPFNDHWLHKVLSAAAQSSSGIAIYGAGGVGQRVLTLLSKMSIIPVCFIDQSAKENDHINSIPLLSIDTVDKRSIDTIIIASFAFYDEIKETIEQKDLTVNVV